MDKLIDKLVKLPRWNAVVVVAVYSLLLAESIIVLVEATSYCIQSPAAKWLPTIMYISSTVSVFAQWIIVAILIYLPVLLLSGKGKFGDLLFSTSYFYLFQIIALPIVIFLLTKVHVPKGVDVEAFLSANTTIKTISVITNCSYIPLYVFCVFAVRRIFSINYLRSIVACSVPAVTFYVLPLFFS